MARHGRYFLPDQPLHVIQRGNNCSAIFFGIENYEHYRNWLAEAAVEYGCVIHAYVLMANHVHLLVTPERAESLPRTMQDWHRDPISVLDEVPVENAACPAPQLNAVELLELSRVGRSAVLADAAATTAKRMRGVSGTAIISVGTKPAILIPASKPCSTISTKLSSPQGSN